ncbi:hypothetical protein B484DRAFT_441486 [Ochromonadaceae sp. CCMP2298]|nr:hypothetical protein B484DRAFT_441486 [Ochromonadaceae sp. CCMP2298]
MSRPQKRARSGKDWAALLGDIFSQSGVPPEQAKAMIRQAEINTGVYVPSTFMGEVEIPTVAHSAAAAAAAAAAATAPAAPPAAAPAAAAPAAPAKAPVAPTPPLDVNYLQSLPQNTLTHMLAYLERKEILAFTRTTKGAHECSHLLWRRMDYLAVQESKKWEWLTASVPTPTVPASRPKVRPEYLRLRIGAGDLPLLFHLLSHWDLSELREVDITLLSVPHFLSRRFDTLELHDLASLVISPRVAAIMAKHPDQVAALLECMQPAPIQKLDLCNHFDLGQWVTRSQDSITQSSLHFLPKSITSLSLSIPYQLGYLFQDAISCLPRLKRLRLVGGKYLNSFGVSNDSLEELDMLACSKYVFLKYINCPSLKHLTYHCDGHGNGMIATLATPRGFVNELAGGGGQKGAFSYAEVEEGEGGLQFRTTGVYADPLSPVEVDCLPATCILHANDR